jgi:hypothetical protein
VLNIIAKSTYYSDAHLQHILGSQFTPPGDYSVRMVSQLRRGVGRGTDQYVYSFLFVINWISQACQRSPQHQRLNDSLSNTQIGSFMTLMEPLLKVSVENSNLSSSTVRDDALRSSAVGVATITHQQQQSMTSSDGGTAEGPFHSPFSIRDNSCIVSYLQQEQSFYDLNQADLGITGSPWLTSIPPATFESASWSPKGMSIAEPRELNDNTALYVPDISRNSKEP